MMRRFWRRRWAVVETGDGYVAKTFWRRGAAERDVEKFNALLRFEAYRVVPR
jgi:hypothetical protein